MRSSSVAAALIAASTAGLTVPALAQEAPPPEPIRVASTELPSGFTAPGAPPPMAPPLPAPAYTPSWASPAGAPSAPGYAPPTGVPGTPGAGVNAPPIAFGQAPDAGRDKAEGGPRKGSGVAFDVGFGTEMPISVGGLATLEVPGRVLFQLGLGVMPKGYVNALDGILTAVGAYDKSVSQLVRSSLGNSFVLKASAGWRPFTDHGLEILGGYTLMTMGGSVAAGDAINVVLGEAGSTVRVPAGVGADVPLAATLHNLHVTLGWRWLLAEDHLVIRANVSYIQTVAANVGVSLAGMGAQAVSYEPAVNSALNETVSPFFKSYAKAPTLGLSAAYRF